MAGCAPSTTLMALNFWTPPKSAGWVEADKALPRILRRGAADIRLQIAKSANIKREAKPAGSQFT